ncbi:MAG: hypothetical protein ACI4EA_08480 [Candidatus Ornithomonoglobus sp.]
MIKKTGTNGINRAQEDNQRAETDRIAAIVDYVAMMTDIEIPTDEETEEPDNE